MPCLPCDVRGYLFLSCLFYKHVIFLFLKCLWKLTRKIPDMMGSINVEELFLDLDKFFTYYTTLAAVPKDETPFRTVKTIIYHIVNIMGTKVCCFCVILYLICFHNAK